VERAAANANFLRKPHPSTAFVKVFQFRGIGMVADVRSRRSAVDDMTEERVLAGGHLLVGA